MNSLAIVEHATTATQLKRALTSVPMIVDANEAVAHASKIRAVKAALKELGNATDARVAATRLEIALIRRVGQLGAADTAFTGAQTRAMSRGLAALDDAAFEALLSQIVNDMAPVTAWNQYRPETEAQRIRREQWEAKAAQHRKRLLEDGDYYAEWDRKRQDVEVTFDVQRKRSAVTQAVAEIISELDMDNRPFSTRELVTKIREDFVATTQNEYEWADDPEIGSLLEEAARTGLREDAMDVDYEHPKRLTYYDSELGWVRVPWHIASVRHLAAHAEYAQQQADELQSKADALRALKDDWSSRLRAGEPDTTLLSDLSRRRPTSP
jgi:hypothetical protein